MLDSNGHAPSNATSATSNGALNGHAPLDASFWQRPLDEANLSETIWHPPLPSHRASQQVVTDLLGELAEAHAGEREGWGGEARPYQAWYLRWFFETRAQAAQRELEDVLAEVRASARSYATLLQEARATSEQSRQVVASALRDEATLQATPDITLDALLARARHDFTTAAAEARLYVETSAPIPEEAPAKSGRKGKADASAPSTSSASAPAGAHISPRLVEEALDRAAPNMPEVAGMHHLRYPQAEWHGDSHESSGGLARMLSGLSNAMLPLAPLVLGLMVALCLGSVSGLLDIEDLTRRPDVAKVFKFALAVLLGGVIVSVLGKGMEATIRILFDHLSVPYQPAPKVSSDEEGFRALRSFRIHTPPTPRRRRLVVAGCVLMLISFAIAEAVAEGTGLKTLNDLRIANMSQLQQRQYQANPIATWIFYLIGVLFSGAYLYYKGTDTWRRSELEAMKPWLARQRQEWLEHQRGEPGVKSLFQLAYLIEQMEAKREQLSLRLDNARAAAVSEAELLHAMLEWVVYSHGAMPMPTLHLIKSFGVDGANGVNGNGASNGAPADVARAGVGGRGA